MEVERIRMRVEDPGTLRERVVVEVAPALSMITQSMLDMWYAGLAPHVERDGDRFSFGTVGEGVGRVTYAVGPRAQGWLPRRSRFLGRVA